MMPCVPQVFRTRKLEVQPDRPVYQFMTQQVHCIQYFVPSWRQTLVVAFLKKWIMLDWQELEEAQQGGEEKMTKKLQMPPVMEERDAASKVA